MKEQFSFCGTSAAAGGAGIGAYRSHPIPSKRAEMTKNVGFFIDKPCQLLYNDTVCFLLES